MKRGFTLVEILCAVFLVGIITTLSVATFNAVSRGWEISTEYLDKSQRTDYALNQVISGLRSMYYPHDGQQDENYGFVLIDNGDGDDPDSSDVIEWSKTGTAIVGNRSAVADTVHRVQVMILEEGNHDYDEEIHVTGLYARQCPDSVLRPKDDEVDYTFGNDEMYQPVLIADGIVGFNCRVLKDAEKVEAETDEKQFEDEWETSNSVPYKVQLTFRIADPDGRSYRSNTAPLMRIIRIPIFEQSQDGATTPSDEESAAKKDGAGRRGARGGGRPGGAGGGSGGAGGGRPGGAGGAPGAGGPPPGGPGGGA